MNVESGRNGVANPPRLVDPFARAITYLRVSVTDRCDFRCTYCMAETMQFLPKKELLTLEELDRICSVFIRCGIRKLRITGGEPLVRRGIMELFARLSSYLDSGMLDELTLTTNGSQLARFAEELSTIGIRRINVSLDTLDEEKFRRITRWGRLPQVLKGIDAAREAGIRIKINMVALKGFNENELHPMVQWCHANNMDLTIIEVMPMGDFDDVTRIGQYWSVRDVRARLEECYTLQSLSERTGGPARYFQLAETGQKVGFITPLSHNFCESCNRVRLTCTGTLYMCLGQEGSADLRTPLRGSDDRTLIETIQAALARKPRGHDFDYTRQGVAGRMQRHMSHTGG
ncbi:MAG: GTP 3',8-cyclase MoaA [Rhodobacteraceae bacterium]|nr:GTP 3',8-cyclase MoaA [Paracoccaceae bacterium]